MGSVLIRNLARGTNFKCIVANTNSDIANLTGKARSCASRTNPTDVAANRDVWSVVFNCLNNADWDLSFGRVEESINKLIEYCQNKETMKSFFEKLKIDNVPFMLPGIAELVSDFILNFPLAREFKFINFFDDLINCIRTKIEKRQNLISTDIHGRLANYGLFSNYAYANDLKAADEQELAHRNTFLLNHLYLLINPVDLTKFAFLIFRPSLDTLAMPMRIFKNGTFHNWARSHT